MSAQDQPSTNRSAEYDRILSAESDEEALRLESSLLVETDKDPGEVEPLIEELFRGRVIDPAPSQMDSVLDRAAGELGLREGANDDTKYGMWYGLNHNPWCAMFVSWVFFHEGLPLPATTSKGFARTKLGAEWFQSQGKWTTTPDRGHVVFFDMGTQVEGIDHVGIVVSVNADGSINTIEGNTSQAGSRTGCCVKTKERRSAIVGYGIPAYKTTGGNGGNGGGEFPGWPGRLLKHPPPTVGGDVSTWQRRMKERGWRIEVDGIYDEPDDPICRLFQEEKGLRVDGKVGRNTWNAAWTAPVT
jgi:hypothetical protein